MSNLEKSIIEKLKNYKHNRASRFIPVREGEIISRVFELEKYYVSTKYDGHLCFLIKSGQSVLCNYNGISFERPELLKEFEEIKNISDIILIGEIFSYKENERTRSFDLKNDLNDKNSDIRIAVFDLINYNGNEFSENEWGKKKEIINNLLSNGNKIFSIQEQILKSRKDIQSEFNSRVKENNEEGLIIRGEVGPIFKIKPTLNFDFVVLGYVLGYSDDYSLLKELLFGVCTSKDMFLVAGKVSSGFSLDDRKTLVEKLEKIKVDSNIMEVSGSKLPFTMVKPQYIIELDALDIINSNSSGIITKSVLSYNLKYSKLKNSSSISLISPIFKGFRDDKKVSVEDCGTHQITRVIDLPDKEEIIQKKDPSNIINKEVYVKEMRGAKMVKKFFIWKTNGDKEYYPKFVFYQIDYSPSRGDKLKREIKVSSSEKQIVEIFNAEIEKDIKSGWNKI